ncbi:unnamed protein product [Phytomonas sp. Hart1]|nr:unnamed protein product [Phytomonas sp. Hart1]|eukprot:CCW71158.1 unnamed protein product [Phytomonas sp. isolate Hart1]
MHRCILRKASRRFTLVGMASASLQLKMSSLIDRGVLHSSLMKPQQNYRFYSGGGHDEQPTRSGQYLLDKNDVLTRVLEVVKNFEKVDASKVTPESHFVNDLGLNSLDVVEVVFAIEQEFILDIPDHDAEKIQSVPDAVEYISQNPMAK